MGLRFIFSMFKVMHFIDDNRCSFHLRYFAIGDVYIELSGRRILSNETVCLRDIGEQESLSSPMRGTPDDVRGDALICVTDSDNCCRGVDRTEGAAIGEWKINGGDNVPGSLVTPREDIYRNRGTGFIRLNVRNGTMPTLVGQYCCMIPDAMNMMQTVCVTVGKFTRMNH